MNLRCKHCQPARRSLTALYRAIQRQEGAGAPRNHLTCHCEEAEGRRGALSAKREEVPLGCNLAVPGCIVGKLPAKSQLPSRDCHVASLLAMTNLAACCIRRDAVTSLQAPSSRVIAGREAPLALPLGELSPKVTERALQALPIGSGHR